MVIEVRPPVYVTIDPDAQRVCKGAEEIFLTPLEFRILLCMARRRGQLIPKEKMVKECWDTDPDFVLPLYRDTLKAMMRNLRRHLGDIGTIKIYIVNRFGFGYGVTDLVRIGPVISILGDLRGLNP